MGFIKAFAGAIGGTFADQWKDFIVPMSGVPTRDTYTLKIVEPILFIKNFVPATYLWDGEVFDFAEYG